jgi:hypothetical protein
MRSDHQPSGMVSYISAEQRVSKDHPLRAIRTMVDAALRSWARASRQLILQVGRRRLHLRSSCARTYCRFCALCAANGF